MSGVSRMYPEMEDPSRCARCWQPWWALPGQARVPFEESPLCAGCAARLQTQIERGEPYEPREQWPITTYLPDIAALTDDDVVEVARLQPAQAGSTTIYRRSDTELARMIARHHQWCFLGDKLAMPDGVVIADDIETAAAAMAALGWFADDRRSIPWRVFTHGRPPGMSTYPNGYALRRWISEHVDSGDDGTDSAATVQRLH
ncbi:hypothetical protein [Nocardia sp. NPDC059239]|uniref:hypothetical protein n=1 Tax=Nocardia sp. NPDC059239 TaxID=3346785 RepID=UPI00367BDE5E